MYCEEWKCSNYDVCNYKCECDYETGEEYKLSKEGEQYSGNDSDSSNDSKSSDDSQESHCSFGYKNCRGICAYKNCRDQYCDYNDELSDDDNETAESYESSDDDSVYKSSDSNDSDDDDENSVIGNDITTAIVVVTTATVFNADQAAYISSDESSEKIMNMNLLMTNPKRKKINTILPMNLTITGIQECGVVLQALFLIKSHVVPIVEQILFPMKYHLVLNQMTVMKSIVTVVWAI